MFGEVGLGWAGILIGLDLERVREQQAVGTAMRQIGNYADAGRLRCWQAREVADRIEELQ